MALTEMKKETAETVRKACIRAAQEGFRDASMSGLCADGAMEAAVSAIQSLDLEKILDGSRESGEVKPFT